MVNRGWLRWDLKDYRYDRDAQSVNVSGILYRGDAGTKYSKPNVPGHNWYESVNPAEMALICQLGNAGEAGEFMLKEVDLDPATRTPMHMSTANR